MNSKVLASLLLVVQIIFVSGTMVSSHAKHIIGHSSRVGKVIAHDVFASQCSILKRWMKK